MVDAFLKSKVPNAKLQIPRRLVAVMVHEIKKKIFAVPDYWMVITVWVIGYIKA